MTEAELAEAMERVRMMEKLYDCLLDALKSGPERIESDEALKNVAGVLADYLDSGTWMHDYQMDEEGLIPKEIKRGVLSQDGLYDLLSEPAIKPVIRKPEVKERNA